MSFEIRPRDLDLKTYRKIGQNEYCISTVALTIEHYGGAWYETMIFPARNNKIESYGDIYSDRYATKEEAEAGHKRIVEASDAEFQEMI